MSDSVLLSVYFLLYRVSMIFHIIYKKQNLTIHSIPIFLIVLSLFCLTHIDTQVTTLQKSRIATWARLACTLTRTYWTNQPKSTLLSDQWSAAIPKMRNQGDKIWRQGSSQPMGFFPSVPQKKRKNPAAYWLGIFLEVIKSFVRVWQWSTTILLQMP